LSPTPIRLPAGPSGILLKLFSPAMWTAFWVELFVFGVCATAALAAAARKQLAVPCTRAHEGANRS
jgi:hypothetical protein